MFPNKILLYILEKNPCSFNPCDDNAKCFNIDSKPVCICQDGYHGDGYSCEKSKYSGLNMVPLLFHVGYCFDWSLNFTARLWGCLWNI